MQTNKTIIPFWWMAWLVVLLLAFGVPPLVARFIQLSGNTTRELVMRGEQDVPAKDWAIWEEGRRATASWFPSNETYSDLSLITLDRAIKTKGDQAAVLRDESEEWQRRALAVSPADSYGWYRLAYLYYMKDGPSVRAARALKQSIATAPYEHPLTFSRVQMAMTLGPRLGADARYIIAQMMGQAWRMDPDRMADLALTSSYLSALEDVLRNDKESMQELNRILGRN